MKKLGKFIIIIFILVLVSVILFITGKRHDVIIENNAVSIVKYSVNGEPYQILEAGKKAQTFSKGISNVIYFKTEEGKVIEKDLPAKDIKILINESINNSTEWYKELGK